MATRHSNRNARSVVSAVAYYRMSSDKQEASIPEQRKAVERYAVDHGFRLIDEYSDHGVSGDDTRKRKAFQRMIADADRGTFKTILVWDTDRFGRFDSIEAGRWIHPLREAGVNLATVAEGVIDWSDFTGRVMYSIKQEGKHQFLRDLSRNTLRGRIAAARRGEWLSQPPLGYVVENKRLVVGEHATLVRKMFQDYLAGKSLRAIAIAMNDAGHRTQRGNTYGGETVRVTLVNEAYTGTYVWSEKRYGKYHVVMNGQICEPSRGTNDDAIVIPNNHPAIIDRKTFEAVQRRLAARKTSTTPHVGGGDFVFTGILRCGKCGGPMYGCRPTRSNHVRYRCYAHAVRKTCDMNAARQSEIYDAVVGAIQERFQDEKTIQRLRDIMARKLKTQTPTVDAKQLQRQLAKVEADLSKARRNMALADDDDIRREYESVVRELRQECEQIKSSLENAQEPQGRTIAEQGKRIDAAIKSLATLRQTLRRADVAMQRELLQAAISQVRTWSRLEGRTFVLERGEIHLRPEMWGIEEHNLTSSSRSTCQLFIIPFEVRRAA